MPELDLTALDLKASPSLTLFGSRTITAEGTSLAYTGLAAAGKITVTINVGKLAGAAGAGLTVTVQQSEDGESWEDVDEHAFSGHEIHHAEIEGPSDYLRVSWTLDEGLTSARLSAVTVTPSTVNAPESGGSQPIEVETVQISAAELLALDVTPKVLLAAPGGRLYHIVLGIVLHYRFVTTPYTGNFQPAFGFGTTIAEISPLQPEDVYGEGALVSMDRGTDPLNAPPQGGFLTYETDAYLYCVGPSIPNSVWTMWSSDRIEDKAISIGNFPDTPLADGDGTVTARVFYTTIDGAP